MGASKSDLRSTSSIAAGIHGDLKIPWWLRGAVLIGALLMAAGGVIALANPGMLASPHDEINGAVRIYAGYMASRNLSLAAGLLAMLVLGARRSLGILMALTGLIQFVDMGVDCAEGRWSIVPGVLIFGVVFLIGAARLCGRPLWNAAAWKVEGN